LKALDMHKLTLNLSV
jgi:hypothetical protein